ncbi:MAG TPA: NUDIX domain-containing protein [Ktedonosporobacter sp.]|nr:NUDIX domain-containing protein [Ktedonosporobacter sp.]
MVKIIQGDRVGRQGKLSTGCSAIIFDETGQKILLTRRTDNGRWCLPGGKMEAGESVVECCAREVVEETGLVVCIEKLIGVYSSPHILLEYADGNRTQIVNHCFLASPIDGALSLSDETTAFGYFSPAEIEAMDLVEHHRERIQDALAEQTAAFIR